MSAISSFNIILIILIIVVVLLAVYFFIKQGKLSVVRPKYDETFCINYMTGLTDGYAIGYTTLIPKTFEEGIRYIVKFNPVDPEMGIVPKEIYFAVPKSFIKFYSKGEWSARKNIIRILPTNIDELPNKDIIMGLMTKNIEDISLFERQLKYFKEKDKVDEEIMYDDLRGASSVTRNKILGMWKLFKEIENMDKKQKKVV